MESVQNYFKNLIGRIQNWVSSNPRRAITYGVILLALILGFVFKAPPPHVALSGEPIFSNGPKWLTNSLITTIIVDIILIVAALAATLRMKMEPSGWQNAVEALIEYLYGLAESVAGKNAPKFFPISATLFLFILISNYIGLVPGVGSLGFYHEAAHTTEQHEAAPAEGGSTEQHQEGEATPTPHSLRLDGQLAMAGGNLILLAPQAPAQAEEAGEHKKFVPWFRAPSADLNTTVALALITMTLVQVFGVRALGGSYFRKFWNTGGQGFMKGINLFVSVLEAISEISRILTFSFRLFGNIFAGEVVLATMAFLCAYLVPAPFYALEFLVGAVQALVFMMLSLVFFSMAMVSHGDHGHDEAHAGHH
jgi:F-type H+-transporting ATPase subunit a